MEQIRNIFILMLFIFVISCKNENNKVGNNPKVKTKCPCDSIGSFKENDNLTKECYLNKSLIKIKPNISNDTFEVTRFYTTDTVWHVQEYIVIANNEIVNPELSIYCDFKDTASFYKLTFIRNENIKRGDNEPIIDSFFGIDLIMGNDTLSSKTNSILVKKNHLTGIIKIDKKLGGVYHGERGVLRPNMYLDVKNLIEFGNLLEQYKVIKKNCSK